MALRVWLPLDGNLENKGISNYTITSSGSSVVTNGKIGSCMKITSTTSMGYIPDFNNNPLSLGGWFKFNLAEIKIKVDTLTYSSSATSPTGNLLGNTSYGGIGLVWTGNNHYSSGTFSSMSVFATLRTGSVNQSTSSIAIEFDKWIHIMLTWDPNTHILNLYKDGILINSKTFSTFTNGVSRVLSLNYNAIYGGNGPAASIPIYCNDVRIYDHCLSAAEVHEISQGLVLHYKLDNGGHGRNLIRIGTNAYHNTSELTSLTFSGWDSYNSLSLTDMNWNNRYGQKITYSCYVENIEQTAGTGTGIMLHVRYADGTYSQFGGGKNGTIGSYLAQGESGWLKLVVTIPDASARSSPTTISRIQVSIRHNSSSGASTVKYKCPQAELGDQQTPWWWAPEDSGDLNIVQDSSGYGHNGTITGNLTINSNSGRYSSCIYTSSGDTNYITTPTLQLPGDAITMNFWFKSSNTSPGSNYHMPFEGTASSNQSYEMSIYKTGYLRGGLIVAGSRKVDNCTSTKLIDGNWHMCSMTYDGSTIKRYVDGVMEKSTSVTGALVTSSSFVLGHYGSNTSYCSKETYTSDVRLYVTALSADDIKQLYQVSAKVDNLQGLHTFEIKETNRNLLAGRLWSNGYNQHNPSAGLFTNFNSNGEYQFTANGTSAGSEYIPINPTGHTYEYDYTISVNTGNQFYIGFERYDANKTSRSNNACVYTYSTKPSTDIVKQHFTGTVNLSTDGTNPCAFIALRILNGWSGTTSGVTGTATIHSFSLREISTKYQPKLTKQGQFIEEELKEEANMKLHKNGIIETNNLIER